jgi:hypothetical protein
MKKAYKQAVLEALQRTRNHKPGILTEDDLNHLPVIVQKYIRMAGSVGKEKVLNFRAEFKGGIRANPADDYMPMRSVQYNFTDQPTRIFYIVARKMGVPALGLHLYKNQRATMLIKILGLFTVSDARGNEMDKGETVTVFNDMCFMAPSTLIDRNIVWKVIDDLSVEARYTNGTITIGAKLIFNEKGELLNFISNDRYETKDGKTFNNYPWLTPVTGYTTINGHTLPSGAKLIYKHPGEDFCYGEFNLVNIEYNLRMLK